MNREQNPFQALLGFILMVGLIDSSLGVLETYNLDNCGIILLISLSIIGVLLALFIIITNL